MNNDDVLDLTHLISYPNENEPKVPKDKEHLKQWDDYSSTTSAMKMLQEINHLDGKARRRLRRKQERKNKKK